MTFQARFPFPPSVNGMYRFFGKKMYMVDGARRYKWEMQHRLHQLKAPKYGDTARIRFTMHLYPNNNRAFDVDNRAKCCIDAFQDYGMFANDKQIYELRMIKHDPQDDDAFVEVIVEVI